MNGLDQITLLRAKMAAARGRRCSVITHDTIALQSFNAVASNNKSKRAYDRLARRLEQMRENIE